MALRVKPTPTRFPTNSVYTQVENTPLTLYIKCVPLRKVHRTHLEMIFLLKIVNIAFPTARESFRLTINYETTEHIEFLNLHSQRTM